MPASHAVASANSVSAKVAVSPLTGSASLSSASSLPWSTRGEVGADGKDEPEPVGRTVGQAGENVMADRIGVIEIQKRAGPVVQQHDHSGETRLPAS